ncbi:hypothetical protein DEI93_05510 [Curtobacterium sp. MCBD17_035]|uniref:hypothetical protein n=1 Tax=Curtobacterium sp. MCBD17_035 TaxID=2175673 RepID=UPI000DA942A3|nr:hypothetical protein [Curtobacterium sp. MCBD17_035]WIB68494.1 hypothetical protein DEI93_05510 [Curtobacterium sp. MCBD17_035]
MPFLVLVPVMCLCIALPITDALVRKDLGRAGRVLVLLTVAIVVGACSEFVVYLAVPAFAVPAVVYLAARGRLPFVQRLVPGRSGDPERRRALAVRPALALSAVALGVAVLAVVAMMSVALSEM